MTITVTALKESVLILKYLFKVLLIASKKKKKAITKKWLNENPPTKEEWIVI